MVISVKDKETCPLALRVSVFGSSASIVKVQTSIGEVLVAFPAIGHGGGGEVLLSCH